MPQISKDRVNDAGGLAPEGWHRAVASDCQAKTSRSQEAYYNLAFESPDGQFLAYDVAMLEGRGNGIGIAKLLALGACEDIGDAYEYDLPQDVVGKECWIYLEHEEYDGKKRCKVDISQGRCGYLPPSSSPAESLQAPAASVQPEDAAGLEDDIPFVWFLPFAVGGLSWLV